MRPDTEGNDRWYAYRHIVPVRDAGGYCEAIMPQVGVS